MALSLVSFPSVASEGGEIGGAARHSVVKETVETRRLQIPVTLEARGGLSIEEACGDLSPGDITVRVGEEVLQVTGLDRTEQPVRYVIVIDESGSVPPYVSTQWMTDASSFLQGLGPDDSGAVFSFSRKLSIRAFKEAGKPVSFSQLPPVPLSWSTSVNDSLRYALLSTYSPLYHTALIFVSDGLTNSDMVQLDVSRFVCTASRIESLSVYPIIPLCDPSSHGCKPMTPPRGFAALADRTNGQIFRWERASLKDVLENAKDHLFRRRLLTYVPPEIEFNETRRIKVSSRSNLCRIEVSRSTASQSDCTPIPEPIGSADRGRNHESPIDLIDSAVMDLQLMFSKKGIPLTLEVEGRNEPLEIDILELRGTDLFEEFYLNATPGIINPWGNSAKRELSMLAPEPPFLKMHLRSISDVFCLLTQMHIDPPDDLEVSPLMMTGNGFLEHSRSIAAALCRYGPGYREMAAASRKAAIERRIERILQQGWRGKASVPADVLGNLRMSQDSTLEEACRLFESEVYAKDVWWAHVVEEFDHLFLSGAPRRGDNGCNARPHNSYERNQQVWREFVEWTRPRGRDENTSWAVLGDLIVPLVPTWDLNLGRIVFYRIQLRAYHDPLLSGDTYGLGARSLSRSRPTERFLAALDLPPASSLVRFLGKEEALTEILEQSPKARIATEYRLHRKRSKVLDLLDETSDLESVPGKRYRRQALEVSLEVLDGDEIIWRVHGLGFLVKEKRRKPKRKEQDLFSLQWIELRD